MCFVLSPLTFLADTPTQDQGYKDARAKEDQPEDWQGSVMQRSLRRMGACSSARVTGQRERNADRASNADWAIAAQQSSISAEKRPIGCASSELGTGSVTADSRLREQSKQAHIADN